MPNPVLIVTGPVGAGKTTRLAAWAAGPADVGGVLQPAGAKGRRFVDLRSGEAFAMEGADATVAVGRFVFRQAAFDWAEARILEAVRGPGATFVVIDEVGPLELRGEGLADAVCAAVAAERVFSLILVVRDGLVDAVREAFGVPQAQTWTPPQTGQASTSAP